VIGVAVTAGYAVINGLPTVVSALAVSGGIATALVVGAAAGIYPALRAAALTPTEALRAA
jgi:putative ABC transport system permease protein